MDAKHLVVISSSSPPTFAIVMVTSLPFRRSFSATDGRIRLICVPESRSTFPFLLAQSVPRISASAIGNIASPSQMRSPRLNSVNHCVAVDGKMTCIGLRWPSRYTGVGGRVWHVMISASSFEAAITPVIFLDGLETVAGIHCDKPWTLIRPMCYNFTQPALRVRYLFSHRQNRGDRGFWGAGNHF